MELPMPTLRPCRDDDRATILAIINDAAERYRGEIPDDCWHEPYMTAADLDRELAAGVAFTGYQRGDRLVGVMGVQQVGDVRLIRHAYVATGDQGAGVGTALLRRLIEDRSLPILVGTWAAATWAIGFYERNGFRLCLPADARRRLETYWRVSARQMETSVVLQLAA